MKKHILVTGTHRSGSTWTGLVLSRADNLRYVHEPFNIHIKRKKPFKTPLNYPFEYLSDCSENHEKKVKNYIKSFYEIKCSTTIKRFLNLRSFKEGYALLQDLQSRRSNKTLIKDPLAIMSADWMFNNFDIDVVVLIRHPAAFVASLKVKEWYFDFNTFKKQENLINHHCPEFKYSIEEIILEEKDIIKQGILLWNVIHKVILNYKNKYKDTWYFVKHEDLSLNPVEEFKKMFLYVGLEFDKNVEDYIYETTQSQSNNVVILKSTPIQDVNRNSAKNIKSWKKRLTKEEIDQIKLGTEKIWQEFYDENDW